jgi:YHS domain-containing protein
MKLRMLAIAAVCAVVAMGCSRPTDEATASSEAQSASAEPALAEGVVRVTDPSQVCMVNDQFMGRAQIPVAVGGKTYFGCCAMCKQKLETQASARTALDPVSGAPVDKASAVIARDESGKVFYFASEGTLVRFRR